MSSARGEESRGALVDPSLRSGFAGLGLCCSNVIAPAPPPLHNRRMPQHIGIVACSAEGAALCYRTICIEGAEVMGAHDHPEVSMHTHSLGEYKKYYPHGDWDGVAKLMLSSAEKLAHAGAEFLICPDNTIHAAFDKVVAKSPLPWLNIAEEVAKEAQRHAYKRVGVLGTYSLTGTHVYPEKLREVGIGCDFLDE